MADTIEFVKVKGKALQKLRDETNAYLLRVAAGGKRILPYPCPDCEEQLFTPCPKAKPEEWDSLTTCIHCGGTHMKLVSATVAQGEKL